jgi:hypothetical protein
MPVEIPRDVWKALQRRMNFHASALDGTIKINCGLLTYPAPASAYPNASLSDRC